MVGGKRRKIKKTKIEKKQKKNKKTKKKSQGNFLQKQKHLFRKNLFMKRKQLSG